MPKVSDKSERLMTTPERDVAHWMSASDTSQDQDETDLAAMSIAGPSGLQQMEGEQDFPPVLTPQQTVPAPVVTSHSNTAAAPTLYYADPLQAQHMMVYPAAGAGPPGSSEEDMAD